MTAISFFVNEHYKVRLYYLTLTDQRKEKIKKTKVYLKISCNKSKQNTNTIVNQIAKIYN